jgi:hypothetical protein
LVQENNQEGKACDKRRIIIITIIINIIIGKDTISFMQGIYTHIPETTHSPKEYSVAAIIIIIIIIK